jgi:uncharacterized membrane protein
MTDHLPAWKRATSGELRWPVSVVVVLTALVQLTVPTAFTAGPVWVLPTIELAMLAFLVVMNPGAMHHPHLHLRIVSLTLTAVMSLSNVVSAAKLINGLLDGLVSNDPFTLIRVGGTIWLTNVVVMALWYWELDRGGASARARNVHDRTDFLFPQMSSPQFANPNWEPRFLDYFYFSFTNATAFSPTDVLPLTRWAKLLMILQSIVSLLTVALIIARAINTLR